MDLRLVICVAVLAFVAVDARSVVNQRCPRLYCEFGFEPGYDCRCRQIPVKEIKPCDLKRCPPRTTRCEVRGRLAVCVPVHVFPTEPIMPVDPVYPVDPILTIDPILPINVCALAKEIGPCEAYMPRYYYNSASRRCERFIYGGCGGNENNFRTYQECSSRCDRKPRHSYY